MINHRGWKTTVRYHLCRWVHLADLWKFMLWSWLWTHWYFFFFVSI